MPALHCQNITIGQFKSCISNLSLIGRIHQQGFVNEAHSKTHKFSIIISEAISPTYINLPNINIFVFQIHNGIQIFISTSNTVISMALQMHIGGVLISFIICLNVTVYSTHNKIPMFLSYRTTRTSLRTTHTEL